MLIFSLGMVHEWSDSDDEDLLGVETSVLLGIPDGPADVPTDLSDAAVSRIGGHPVRHVLCVYAPYLLISKKGFLAIFRTPNHIVSLQSM